MNSRMDKYYDSKKESEKSNKLSRSKKNQELYKEVSSLELEDFDLNSNVSVIGNNTNSINIDEIKNILDKKYHEKPKKKSFGDIGIQLSKLNLDETREYDINSILEKAKEKKEVNYEEDRLKKLRNTQYDILKSLDIFDKDEDVEEKEEKVDKVSSTKNGKAEKKLQDLIDTITAKELIKNEESLTVSGEMDPLDILSDLRGDDDATRVMGMLPEEIAKVEQKTSESDKNKKANKDKYDDLEDTLGIEDTQIDIEIEEQDDEDKVEEQQGMTRTDIIPLDERRKLEDSSAYLRFDDTRTRLGVDSPLNSQTTAFSQSDFDDFYDLKEDVHITKLIVRILIVVIIIIFIFGLVVLANKFLQLGLF